MMRYHLQCERKLSIHPFKMVTTKRLSDAVKGTENTTLD